MTDCEPFLTFEIRNAIFAHMEAETPNECCGWITLADGQYTYVPRKNVHPDPENHFRMKKQDAVNVMTNDAIVAYVHSHPAGPMWASKGDMETQIKVNKPCVIVARDLLTGTVDIFSIGNHLLDYPLEGREFHYTRFDCYEAIRSEAWQRERRRMEAFPRKNGWWNPHENPDIEDDDLDMYERYYETQGYTEFKPVFDNPNSEFHPRIGDLVLMQLGSKWINHAAVYVGNNQVYHHRVDKRSGRTPIGAFMHGDQIRKWIRHENSVNVVEFEKSEGRLS